MSKIFLSLFLIFFLGCSDSSKKSENTLSTKDLNNSKKSVKKDNYLILKDVYGEEFKLKKLPDSKIVIEGFEEKALLFEFFTTWCPPCKGLIPHINMLQKEFEDDLVVFAVLLEENKDNEFMQEYIDNFEINYIILNDESNFELLKINGNVKSIPYMTLYDKKGKFFTNYIGQMPQEMISLDIKRMLNK